MLDAAPPLTRSEAFSGNAVYLSVTARPAWPWNHRPAPGVKPVTMIRVNYRWLLPLGHALIDCILLVALAKYFSRPIAVYPPAYVEPALFLQESASIEWDPRTLPPPGPFMLITSGNLPAGLISDMLRPEAGFVGRGRSWDRIWFLMQEVVACFCWFLIGLLIDAGRPRLGKVMIAYLAVRGLLALAGIYDIGWRIQALFWEGFILWLAGVGGSRAIKILRTSSTTRICR